VKVVTAEEMARLEQKASGHEEAFMDEAGRRVAETARRLVLEYGLSQKMILLAGTGNNGGDGFAAALHLMDAGFVVSAYMLDTQAPCSKLNQLYAHRFRDRGGVIHPAVDCPFARDRLVLDGLLGSGCRKEVHGPLAGWIAEVNRSGSRVLAIDLPSGINGTTGEGAYKAIRATATITLGFPKVGLFIGDAWNCTGRLSVGSFGLSEELCREAQAVATLPQEKELAALLPPLVRNRHKYQAGLVVGLGGSATLPGAPKLSSLAALRTGAGLMHLFYPQEAREEMRDLPWEVIHGVWNEAQWSASLTRAKACFFGPGLGRSDATGAWLNRIIANISLPCVIDADALYLLKKMPRQAVLTPHSGEMKWLRDKDEDPITLVRRAADDHGAVILLKGAPTFICAPGGLPEIITAGDPGMATAGAGDVLTGIIAALLAQGCVPLHAALLGAFIHGSAGEFAAQEKSSYGLIARDLIDSVPRVLHWMTGY